MPVYNPPLLGDGNGIYRIHVVGNSGMSVPTNFLCLEVPTVGLTQEVLGAGKSTFAAYLSAKLDIPHIPLDKISWNPGWKKVPTDEFKERVTALMAQHTKGWIIDGRCGKLGALVPDNATDIIWLDPPLHYYLPRLLWRTFLRILGLSPQCAEGCEETWGEVFSDKGIVWWCITNHSVIRTKYTTWLSQSSREAGGKLMRLDESQGELAKWKDDLEEHCRQV